MNQYLIIGVCWIVGGLFCLAAGIREANKFKINKGCK